MGFIYTTQGYIIQGTTHNLDAFGLPVKTNFMISKI